MRRGGIYPTVMEFTARFQADSTDGEKLSIWDDILAKLQMIADWEGKIDWEVHMGDSTVVRGHQHAAGAKGGKKTKRL